jgi:hypothetical protein
MSTVYKYKIYCVTENKYVEGFSTGVPTTCYNNNTHSINPNSYQLLDTISTEQYTVKEDKVPVARNVVIECIQFVDVKSASSQSVDFKFDIVTSMYSFKFMADDTNKGDEITISVNPDTTLGLITSSITAGATTIGAPPGLLAYGWPGFNLKLTDGVNTDDIGRILAIDKINSTVTFSIPTVHSFSSTDTLVKMTYYTMRDLKIGPSAVYAFCEDIIGGSAPPSGTVVRFTYKNNSQPGDLLDQPKSLNIYLTLLF